MNISTNSLSDSNAALMLAMQPDTWRGAYHVALANAAIFLLLALVLTATEPGTLALILSVPAIFFLGSMLAFLLMVRSGGALAAASWFVFGSGFFFGLGVIAGGLHAHPHSDYLFGSDTRYLIQVNLLNACSVLVVLAVAYPLANMQGRLAAPRDMSSVDTIEPTLKKVFPYVVAISAVAVGLKYTLFPVADSLLLRGLAAKIYLIIPACFMLLGLLWRSSSWPIRLIAGGVFMLDVLNGLIGFSKYPIVVAMLALAIGIWLAWRSTRIIVLTLLVMAFVYIGISHTVSLGRAHIEYDPVRNSVLDRLAILANVGKASLDVDSKYQTIADNKVVDIDLKEMSSIRGRLGAVGMRLDVASIQGYLINEYDSGRPGKSFVDYWAVFIPRVLWPEKPIITRFGTELNAKYYFVPGGAIQNTSSIAPTYSAESYWNHGYVGVIVVSGLLGMAIGWLTRCWQRAAAGQDYAFLLIAFPVVLWAGYVESWVVATYLGEFVIFVVLLFLLRAGFSMPSLFKHSAPLSRLFFSKRS